MLYQLSYVRTRSFYRGISQLKSSADNVIRRPGVRPAVPGEEVTACRLSI